MSSAGVIIVWAMSFLLVCLAAMPPLASGAASGSGGILYIPSAASLAHCPSSCGGVTISYPFGVGAGCFRQGFELICDRNTQPPKLFLGNSTTQITSIYGNSVKTTPMFFNITLGSGTNNRSISWETPAKGIIVSYYSVFYALGCDFDVELFDHVGNPIDSCMSRCHGGVLPNQGHYCNNTGCCYIFLTGGISGFQATIVRAVGMAARPDFTNSGIMAFISSSEDYRQNATDLFSVWTNASKIDGAALDVAIMDQPSCESAQINNVSYACATNSICTDASYGGYSCGCPVDSVAGSAYLSEGCMLQQDYYNPKPKEHCRTSCGNMNISFPFGLDEGSFGNERFQLNCTAAGETLFSIGDDAQFHVTAVSVEDGTLTVSNMLINSSFGKEAIISPFDQYGDIDVRGPVEDEFDFSLEYDIVIRWAVTNSTCQKAQQNMSSYACRSVNSSCQNVTHGKIFMGYRCNCSSGYNGNPYILEGCKGVIQEHALDKLLGATTKV